MLERKVQALCCGLLIILAGLGALVPSIRAERSVWSIETVDSTGTVGYFTSLALDSSGYPHISYFDSTNDDLKYAYKDSGGWHTSTVDSTGSVGRYTSLALDTGGYPHISYYDYEPNRDLKYAYMDGGGWHISTVDSTGSVGLYTSLALDTGGYPHISYCDLTNWDLKYAYMDGGGWHISTVDITGDVGLYTSLALDTGGYPHISYYDVTNGDLKYAYMDGGGWHIVTVDTGNVGGGGTSLVLDTGGYPHISYQGASGLNYAYSDGFGWLIGTVDSTDDVGHYPSLALDTSGYPRISYMDYVPNYDLKYAYRDGGGWHTSTVDSTGNVGEDTSLALDTGGYPHISYYDDTNHDLKYAHLADTTPPAIANVHAIPSIQLPGGEVAISCTVTDNLGVGDARVNITYPDSSSVNVSLSPRGGYEYSDTHSQPGTYTYFIWANDTSGNTATSGLYQFTIAATDYLKITYDAQNEIPDTILSTNFTLDCYAGAFNDTHGFITFVDATWNLQNSGGSNASINTSSGESAAFFSGWYDGTVTVIADDGSGHLDTVVFTVEEGVFSMMINAGWNFIGWSQDYATDVATLAQYIPGCTVVCKFDSNSQSYVTHVVGIPYNIFTITQSMGLFVYTTEAGIWDGTDGTI